MNLDFLANKEEVLSFLKAVENRAGNWISLNLGGNLELDFKNIQKLNHQLGDFSHLESADNTIFIKKEDVRNKDAINNPPDNLCWYTKVYEKVEAVGMDREEEYSILKVTDPGNWFYRSRSGKSRIEFFKFNEKYWWAEGFCTFSFLKKALKAGLDLQVTLVGHEFMASEILS